jgi:hypothetical protein
LTQTINALSQTMLYHQHQNYDSMALNIKRNLTICLALIQGRLNGDSSSRCQDSLNIHKSKCGMASKLSLETQRSIAKCVTFGSVEIREYGRVLTEHPECRDGLAIGIDWKHAKKSIRASVDAFEKMKYRKGNRGKKRMVKLSTLEKKDLLVDVGGYPTDFLRHSYRRCCIQNEQIRNYQLLHDFRL